ncbi:GNAT family N-acetyltransferase [Rhizobium leguminosarum]|uniref:GNAT family N-acetyltransferase n=1 Tax=Rhizobium leguminosarum TaxID=384 RepID=UPI002E0DACAC|nr:GNAT family N-acetyltransferase [Rhizobium leguminosarum]
MMGDRDAVVVRQIVELPDQFDQLLLEAEAEGFEMISVLQDEWRSGANRFERPGEILALATIDGEVAGIGGTTQDFMDSGWLRMRRFYVRPAYRRLGVGRQIALFVLEHAKAFARPIVLYTAGPEAEVFWPTIGFTPIERENTTHIFRG